MAKESATSQIKQAVIGVVVLAITSAGGLLVNKMLGAADDNEEVKKEVVTPAQPTININIPQQETKTDTVVKKVYVKPKPKPKTDREKRKEEGIDW
tara:strand:- start:401 stop:688 length:288 start_codon:yes stop_codon:yes gene_type:complete